MNKKGFTVIEVMLTVSILGILMLILYNFNSYYNNHIVAINKTEVFTSHVDLEVSRMYSEEVIPGEKTIPTKHGDISVSIGPEVKTDYGTFSYDVKFKTKGFEREYNIERSEYHED